ncbi:intermembrane phospholipid transport protein YdbH family protein [Alkalimonas mucilaginosa]|uniref:YdbH domain-containing protein n=1 Tax=Alkalimonas mucilaginosa TaxID=3057676 RepID=A0ABU7JIQ9_9GAMM|nr:YdbH domain-containing protein [Alkalimonas sp. MEB004]MEE2025594.1 YdbH domain-containing protein [Alkalimonas sp. MEB004]
MRRFFRIFSLSLTLLLCLLLAAFLWLQHQLRQLPITNLDYQISQWGLRQLRLEHLHFDYLIADAPLHMELNQVHLSWHWQGLRPQLNLLTLHQLDVRLASMPQATESAPKAAMQLPEHWHWPDWLPAQSRIDWLQLDLPCDQLRCIYQGSLELTHQTEQLDVSMQLYAVQHSEHPLSLQLSYQLQQHWPQLELMLQLDEVLQLELSSNLQAHSSDLTDTSWQGAMAFSLQPPPSWLVTELASWQLELPELWLSQFRQQVSASSQWQFAVPPQLSEQWWQHLNGSMQLQLSSPSPLYLPDLGLITAELQASAEFNQGQLAPFRVAAGGTLTEIVVPEPLLAAGFKLPTLYWSLSSQHSEALSLAALPLQFRLDSADQQHQLHAIFNLDLLAQKAQLEQLQLRLVQPELRAGDWQLSAVELAGSLSGSLSAQQLQLRSSSPLQLQAKLENPELSLQIAHTSLHLNQLQLESRLATTETASHRLSSRLVFNAEQLQQPQLKTLDWQWQGNLSANSSKDWQLSSAGELIASSGLELRSDVQANTHQVTLHWQLADVFMLAGNTLASTMADWPELLTLQRGRIKHQGELRLALADQSYQLHSTTELLELAGFYDTTTFRGINGQLLLAADPKQLQLSTSRLAVEQFEQGVMGGPLHLAAQYQAEWDAPTAGMLQLHDNELILFNGRISVPAMALDLSQPQWLLPLHIKQLDLQQLLTQHPTSDLTGHGLIDGEIPLIISARGVEVAQGRLRALEPGGSLSYRSPQAQGMAASNPGMKMIIAALDDFHYSVLSSDVSYSTDGHLTLALRLEGRNPAMEGGRPVHFNITLEENIPALITSLQLTNQLNEVIQKRVQERLQRPRQP